MATNPVVVSRRPNLWGRIMLRLSRDLGAWLYVAAVLGLVSVLVFVYLAQASYVAGQIQLMAELEGELEVLHEENSILLLRIARVEDMSRIKAEARAMGLGEAARTEYVVVVLEDPGDGATLDALSRGASPAQAGRSSGDVWGSAAQGTGLRAAIVQQFQAWIGGGTASAAGSTLSGQSVTWYQPTW